MSQQEAEGAPDYDAVDTRVGPVPVPMRAKRIRPVKVVSADGTVKRETDTEAILPDLYRVWGLEVVARDDVPKCKVCGAPANRGKGAWRATCGAAACRRKMRSESARERNASRTPEQRSEAARKGWTASTREQRSEAMRKTLATVVPELLRERARKGKEAMTPEQRRDAARKANATRTPEQRSDASRKANAEKTPEQRSEAKRKAWETRRARKAAAEEKAK